MLCLPLAVILLAQVTHPIRTAYVTSSPSLVARLDRMYEKLEKLTVAPAIISPSPIPYLSDEEEELLTAMQIWGDLTPDQLNGVAKDLQRIRADADEDRTERLSDLEYADLEDNEEDYTDIDYHNNGKEDEDEEDNDKYADQPVISVGPITASKKVSKTDYDSFIKADTQASTLDPKILNVTPLAFTKNKSKYETIISAVDSIAATNERPRILEELSLTPVDRQMLRKAALANIAQVIQAGKCLVPQPRWLSVRQLLPAANIRFIPPCVQLHRCASDSGCCLNEGMVCAPVDGQYVAIPFYLHKANENVIEARMMFYNHTTCACVDRKTLQATTTTQRNMITHSVMTDSVASSEQRQNDWRPPSPTQAPTVETTEADDATAPPQLKRCTCPTYFLANITDSGTCSCACDWRDAVHRRECLLFSRGKEHLGLRDRVCIAAGNCAPPVCDFGAYDMTVGKCPIKKLGVKRIRFSYHMRRHQQDKNVV